MIVFPTRLIKLSAWALILAGVLVTFVNLIFTPQILAIEDFAQSAASMAWAWRLGLASLTGILLVISAFGILALFEKKQPGTLRGLLLFVILIIGNILLVAHEWNQWLFVRDLAIHFPETLNQLEDLESFSLFDLSAAIGTLGFFLSWLITAILLLWGRVVNKWTGILIIAGIIASPFLAAIFSYVVAAIISSTLLGIGWILLGRSTLQLANALTIR